MRFAEISHSPKERLKAVLETLDKEFKITLDFNDIDGLKKLETIALENIEKAKDNAVSVFEDKTSRVTANYLILEAIKINEEINMKKVNEASEIEKAEYLLASKNIVDDLQGMIEDISKIQAEKISSIADRIKVEQGLDAAENYKTTASSLLSALNDSLGATKDGIDNLTLSLSGDVNMAQAPGVAAAAPAAGEAPPELPGAEEEPAPEAEAGPKQLPNPLGRERKEESRSRIGKAITESEQGTPNELSLFHVQVHSPDGTKLFGNYKIKTNEAEVAKHTAKQAVMKKHGMAEWNEEYKFNIKEFKGGSLRPISDKERDIMKKSASSPATPTAKQVTGKVAEKLGDGKAFKKVEKAAAKSGAKNPAAVAAAAGIKKYGVKKMEKMAHAHESTDEPNTFADDACVQEDFEKEYDKDGNVIINNKGTKAPAKPLVKKK